MGYGLDTQTPFDAASCIPLAPWWAEFSGKNWSALSSISSTNRPAGESSVYTSIATTRMPLAVSPDLGDEGPLSLAGQTRRSPDENFPEGSFGPSALGDQHSELWAAGDFRVLCFVRILADDCVVVPVSVVPERRQLVSDGRALRPVRRGTRARRARPEWGTVVLSLCSPPLEPKSLVLDCPSRCCHRFKYTERIAAVISPIAPPLASSGPTPCRPLPGPARG